MKRRFFCSIAVCFLIAAADRSYAQVSMPAQAFTGGDSASLKSKNKKKNTAAAMTRLSLAISLAFDTTTWAGVGVSTAAPAVELARILRQGYYRLELLQLILMAERIGARLSDLTVERKKVKKSLRRIAEGLGIDYDALYEESWVKALEVERRVESVSRVSVSVKGEP